MRPRGASFCERTWWCSSVSCVTSWLCAASSAASRSSLPPHPRALSRRPQLAPQLRAAELVCAGAVAGGAAGEAVRWLQPAPHA